MKKDPKCSPRVSDSLSVTSLCRANDDVKGFEDQVVDASKRDLFCQISSAFCLCASLLRPLFGVGEENVMSRVSERRLSQPNAIKVAPTQAWRGRLDEFCECKANKMVTRYLPVGMKFLWLCLLCFVWEFRGFSCLAFGCLKGWSSMFNVCRHWEKEIRIRTQIYLL